MAADKRTITRVADWFAGAMVILLAAALPTVYFLIAWNAQDAAIRTETEIHAHEVQDLINKNPEMWTYETARLDALLSGQSESRDPESRRVLDLDGKTVVELREELASPVMTRRHPVMDAGVPAGTLEISRSMRPLVVRTVILAVVGVVVGLGLFLVIIQVYPMSALRKALELLSREKERAQVTLHSIGEGVITTDSEGSIVLVNRVAQDMTGWRQNEAAGKPIDDVFRREGGVLEARDGTRRMIEAAMSPILDEGGRSFGTVLVFRDVTEKVQTEAELLKAQKLESLGILAAGIAHEIRNPLSAINISISSIESVCRKSEGLEPEAREKIRLLAEQMGSAATKMASVVQRVMEFSKPARPRKEMADLNGAVEEAVRLSSSTLRKREIVVLKDLAADLPVCRADPRLIEQVLINLITNACQAMDGIQTAKYLEVASAVQDGHIVLRVSDSGPGIPPPIRGRIFDPFFTTRKDGSGIGLAFSHRIVADHGGTLTTGVSKWGGAEFRIAIPAARQGIPV